MNSDTPKYVAPPPDPGLELLTRQNEYAKVEAIQDRVSSASSRLMQQYGVRAAMSGSQNVTPLLGDVGRMPLFMPGPLLQLDPAPGATGGGGGD